MIIKGPEYDRLLVASVKIFGVNLSVCVERWAFRFWIFTKRLMAKLTFGGFFSGFEYWRRSGDTEITARYPKVRNIPRGIIAVLLAELGIRK